MEYYRLPPENSTSVLFMFQGLEFVGGSLYNMKAREAKSEDRGEQRQDPIAAMRRNAQASVAPVTRRRRNSAPPVRPKS